MKVLLLSDLHGNFDALEAVLDEAAREKYREIWFLGDLGGYGPETGLCYNRLASEKALMIPGNHDAYYVGRIDKDLFSTDALKALVISGQSVNAPYRERMKHLPENLTRKGCRLVHGSLTGPMHDYILSAEDAWENFQLLGRSRILLFGHTHRQGCFIETDRDVRWLKPAPGEIVGFGKNRILINPGSAGQPRDGDPRAAWAILDLRKKEICFKRTSYNIASYQSKMRKIKASDLLIERVDKGI